MMLSAMLEIVLNTSSANKTDDSLSLEHGAAKEDISHRPNVS